MYSENWIPALLNTAHSCSQHGPVIPWLTSEWPGSDIPIPKTFTLMAALCLSQCNDESHYKTNRTADKPRKTEHQISCRSIFQMKGETCESHDHIFETKIKRLEQRALCFPPYLTVCLPPR